MRWRLSTVLIIWCISVFGMSRNAILMVTAQDDEAITIRVAMKPPSNLDPVITSRFDRDKRDLLENLLVGLTRFDARSGTIIPSLAESWTVSADGLRWTFYLRDDVQWVRMDKGEPIALRPVVAADIVFAIQRACDPNRPSPVTDNMAVIAGCYAALNLYDAWRVDQAYLDTNIGVRVIDELTVEFRLAFAAPSFLTMTATPEFRPLPDEFTSPDSFLMDNGNIVTSGPWVVAETNATRLRLIENPFWELPREGNLNGVEVLFNIPTDNQAAQFTSGAFDIGRVDAFTATNVRFAQPDAVRSMQGINAYFIGFSFEQAPFDNPLIRSAFAMALNRDLLAQQLSSIGDVQYQGFTRFTPNNVIATAGLSGVGFNLAQAQANLAAAGYPQCQGLPAVTLVVENDVYAIEIGRFVTQQWQTNLGCTNVTFATAPDRQSLVDNAHRTIDETNGNARFQLWLWNKVTDYPDAHNWLSDLHCQYGWLRVGRSCDNNDVLLDQTRTVMDIGVRSNIYTQIETNFFGTVGSFPIIPLAIQTSLWVQQPWLSQVPSYGPFQFDRWQYTQ